MRIVITGHTSPMGRAVYEYYAKSHLCLGVSRTTGHDLTTEKGLNYTIDEALKSDLLLNIAHVGVAQSTLLIKLKEKWNTKSPLNKVITIGSLVTTLPKSILHNITIDPQYLKDKIFIDVVHKALANEVPFGPQLKFNLIRVLNYGEKSGDRQGEPTCTAQDIIRTIDYVINEPMYVSTIDVRRL
jgi:hypothetical protein